ncbi:MAG: hypothetical protein DWQ37_06380 [Planctomycetota bacterium]|nr:MAG: hypothetical protein DWQ37_06380 [Planctomycetota bacterium]
MLLAEGRRGGERLSVIAADYGAYWEEHLKRCRQFIGSGAEGLRQRATATVIGAGACRDIPLADLLRTFEVVRLVDIDASSLDQTFQSVSDDPDLRSRANRLDCQVWDATDGRLGQLMADTAAALTVAQDLAEAMVAITRLFGTAASAVPQPPAALQADYVISSGVSSQLIPAVQEVVRAGIGQRFQGAAPGGDLADNYRRAEQRLRRAWLENHATLLQRLCHPGGRVCWIDTVAEAPFWGNLVGDEFGAVLRSLEAYFQQVPFPPFALSAVQAALRNARTPDEFLAVPSQLIRRRLLHVEQGQELIAAITDRVIELCPRAVAATIPGGLAAYCGDRLTTVVVPQDWRWYLKPDELAALTVEACLLVPVDSGLAPGSRNDRPSI